jgi:hypothetical protein
VKHDYSDIFKSTRYEEPVAYPSYTLTDNINRAIKLREKTPKTARHRFEKTASAWDMSIKEVKRPVSPMTMRVNK